jgi:hypothetical protein
VGIGHSDEIDGMVLKAHAAARVVEHGNTMLLECVGHGALAVDVIVIAEDCEATERRFQSRQGGQQFCAWVASSFKAYARLD